VTAPQVDLGAADGLAAVRQWLLGHPTVQRVLGGPDRVGPYNTPPYPRLRLTRTPGGSLRGGVWLVEPEVLLEVLGDLDGAQSPADLERALLTIAGVAVALPDAPAVPGGPVVTSVQPTGGFGFAPLPSGQPRAVATVSVHVHPPTP
jgi:hypothetical protein